ncbi:MAG: C40 family peptidase [Bacteroidetes bacterium]|nr:C40 family peptidase [Bacteroidota bacterium]
MSFVIAIVPVSPMRSEASHRAEMVSQLLFGETAKVLESIKDFTKIQCIYDDYIGWCQTSQLAAIPEALLNNSNNVLTANYLSEITCNGASMQIPMGCLMGLFQKGQTQIGNDQFSVEVSLLQPSAESINEAVIKAITIRYLNTPYLWGGKSIFGIDCSGFTQQVYRSLGIALPRDAYQQAALGEVVGFLQEAKCGDLAFFDNAEGKITHTGLMLNNATIIHSSGKVRIDSIDNMGIINKQSSERTHQLRIIKRYFL